MRIKEKEKFLSVLNHIQSIHNRLEGTDFLLQKAALEDCIAACNIMQKRIERESKDSIINRLIQEYQKVAEGIVCLPDADNIDINVLNTIISELIVSFEQLTPKYQIVFMPYKAAVWDSLESVYLAAKNDVNCEVLLVPIPYYEMNATTGEKHLCYEGELFPKDEPVTKYSDYNLEEEHPEVIYIHNPYDQYNHVTNVLTEYYSANLKKHTDCLVYIPYYVTSGFFARDHRMLSVYQNMDYMVCQSKFFKKCAELDKLFYTAKMLPLGSPKLDKVVHKCKDGYVVPETWKPMLHGKKSVMLNTSLNCVLYNTQAYLEKLRYIFREFHKLSDVVLVWRPHPLLFSTLQSMRPEFYQEYVDLKTAFVEEQIGIYDDTIDIENTVAIVDAYIGEVASSVVNLFGAAGKPLFILNNAFRKELDWEERTKLLFGDIIVDNDRILGLSTMGIWSCRLGTNEWHLEGEFLDKNNVWQTPAMRMQQKDDIVYLSPHNTTRPISWCDGTVIPLKEYDTIENILATKLTIVDSVIYYITMNRGCLLAYDINTGEWSEYRECIRAMEAQTAGTKYEDAYDIKTDDNGRIWLCATHSNHVVCFDTKSKQHEVYEVGDASCGFSALIVDDNQIWLGEVNTGSIYRYSYRAKDTKIYMLPKNYRIRPCSFGRRLVHYEFIDMGSFFVSIPYFGSNILRVEKANGSIVTIATKFTEPFEQDTPFYTSEMDTPIICSRAIDERKLIAQRCCDGALAVIDIESDTMTTQQPYISDEQYYDIKSRSDGFERVNTCSEFSRWESTFFSLEEFLEELESGIFDEIKPRQLKALENMAENMDGSCGSKVHQTIMSTFRKRGEES